MPEQLQDILIYVEGLKDSNSPYPPKIEGATSQMVVHHLLLMQKAGYIEFQNHGNNQMSITITWQGYDLLDSLLTSYLK